jgi:hypothetical protein
MIVSAVKNYHMEFTDIHFALDFSG